MDHSPHGMDGDGCLCSASTHLPEAKPWGRKSKQPHTSLHLLPAVGTPSLKTETIFRPSQPWELEQTCCTMYGVHLHSHTGPVFKRDLIWSNALLRLFLNLNKFWITGPAFAFCTGPCNVADVSVDKVMCDLRPPGLWTCPDTWDRKKTQKFYYLGSLTPCMVKACAHVKEKRKENKKGRKGEKKKERLKS